MNKPKVKIRERKIRANEQIIIKMKRTKESTEEAGKGTRGSKRKKKKTVEKGRREKKKNFQKTNEDLGHEDKNSYPKKKKERKKKEKPSLSHPLQLHPPVLPFPFSQQPPVSPLLPLFHLNYLLGWFLARFFFFFSKKLVFPANQNARIVPIVPKEEKSQSVGPKKNGQVRGGCQEVKHATSPLWSEVLAGSGHWKGEVILGKNGHEMFWAFGFFEARISTGWELALREIWGDVEWGRG